MEMRSMIRIAILVCVVAVAMPAGADDRGFYVGVGLGMPSYNFEDFAPDAADLRFEEDGFGFRVFGGYRLMKNLGFELGWQDFGSLRRWETDTSRHDLEVDISIDAIDLSVLGIVPLGKKASGFLKLGASSWNTDVTYKDDDLVEKVSEDGTQFSYGLGVDFFFKRTGLRLEGTWLDVPDAGLAFMLIGSLTVNF